MGQYKSETEKIRDRVLRYCNGDGLDIGCGADKIKPDAVGVDKKSGPCVDIECDVMDGSLSDRLSGTVDYVFSSHCLEDIEDTRRALKLWASFLKRHGLMILQVPHPDLYTGTNLDHKHDGFTVASLVFELNLLHFEILEAWVDDGPERYSTVVVARKQ